jgi:hypothetical protein
MRYLQRTRDLAEDRGYLSYPEVQAFQDRVPSWFQALGTDSGLATFEIQRGLRVPAALREFYQCPLLACFVEAAVDGEVFLTELGKLVGQDLPPVVEWSAGPHLVFSFHSHSGTILAAELGQDDPRVFAGFDGDSEPFSEEDWPPSTFSDLMFEIVDKHEAKLDYWQSLYEKSQAKPAARRIGGLEWVRELPGMSARLGRS